MKTETLKQEISTVLDELEIPAAVQFPHMRVTGGDADSGGSIPDEKYFESDELAEKYFRQLTKKQVIRLYEMYKIDHDMFGYDPQVYIDMARP